MIQLIQLIQLIQWPIKTKFYHSYLKEKKEPIEELVEDVLKIMNVFVAKMNLLWKYKEI